MAVVVTVVRLNSGRWRVELDRVIIDYHDDYDRDIIIHNIMRTPGAYFLRARIPHHSTAVVPYRAPGASFMCEAFIES